MIEFRLIDFQTYTAIKEAFDILEEASQQPFTNTILGGGGALAYIARLREIAATDITNPDTGVADPEKIRATAKQISPLLRTLAWTNDARILLQDGVDVWGVSAKCALKNIQTVTLDQLDTKDQQ